MSLQPDATGVAELTVAAGDLASALNQRASDGFPPVLATARMIGLMELAGSRALQPLLKDGEMSVGVSIEVTHTAATPQGVKVTAQARFTGMDGKLYLFDLIASDPGGEIGRGTHRRAIVSAERLVAGARRRCNLAS